MLLPIAPINKRLVMNWTALTRKGIVGIIATRPIWDKFGEKFGNLSRTAYVDAFMESTLTPGNLHVLSDFCKYIATNLDRNGGMAVAKNDEWISVCCACRGTTSTMYVDTIKTTKIFNETKEYFKKYYNLNLYMVESQIVSVIICFMTNNDFPGAKK